MQPGEPTHWVTAEPLTPRAFAPFGDVIALGAVPMAARDGEELTLDVIHYDRRPFVIDHLNRHHRADQALVPLGGKPCAVVVGAPELALTSVEEVARLRCFVLDGSAGIVLRIGTWHEGPWPLMQSVDLVNLQGRRVLADDNEVAHLTRDLGVVLGVRL